MIANFICVYNIKDKKIENVTYKELVENDYLIPADEWADFLINYDEVIRAIIIDNITSIYINPLDSPPRAYNEINDCFSMTAICLYQKLKENALKLFYYSSTRHWYFNLKTLTYVWRKNIFKEKTNVSDYVLIENKFIPIVIWKSFIAKRQFGRLISTSIDKKEINRQARSLWLKENEIDEEEYLKYYE